VIGTVGSREKASVARACGCAEVLVLGDQDLTSEVRRLTGGRGVDVAYDSVGRDTFMGSLGTIRPLGMLVSFGQSSGPVEPLDIGLLAQKGSIFLSKPTLATFTADAGLRQELASGLFHAIRDGIVKTGVTRRASLADVVAVHRSLEGRSTTGATVLVP
jgi:NADPH2:quinone reductase